MGIAYDFLDFLNGGVLPAHPQYPENPFLKLLVSYGRDQLEATQIGDILLWMIDHGVELPDYEEPDDGEYEPPPFNPVYEEICAQDGSAGQLHQIYQTIGPGIFAEFDGDIHDIYFNVSVHPLGCYKVQQRVVVSSYDFAVSFQKACTMYLRPNDAYTVAFSKFQITGSPESFDSYNGEIVPSFERLRSLTAPMRSCCGYHFPFISTDPSASLFCEGFYGVQLYGGSFENMLCAPIAPPVLLPDVVNWGYVTYSYIGGDLYFPWDSTTLHLSEATGLALLAQLTILRFRMPFPKVDGRTPLEYYVFGDMPFPSWYQV